MLASGTGCANVRVHITVVLKVVRTCWVWGVLAPCFHQGTCGSEKHQRSSSLQEFTGGERDLPSLRVRLLAKASEVHISNRVKVRHNAR